MKVQWAVLFAGVVFSLTGSLGCGTRPVSNIAVEGTTIAIAIPAAFDVGYGRSLYQSGHVPTIAEVLSGSITGPYTLSASNLGREDLQRGELVLLLTAASTGTPVAVLPVKFVMSLGMDPRSPAARDSTASDNTQAIVFADLPLYQEGGLVDLVPDGSEALFRIEFRRFRRTDFSSSNSTYAVVPSQYFTNPDDWVGWGNAGTQSWDPSRGVPIRIRDAEYADGSENTNYSFVANGVSFPVWALNQLSLTTLAFTSAPAPEIVVPDPSFKVSLNLSSFGPTDPLPAAMEFEVTYPADRIEIAGSDALRTAPAATWIGYSTSPSVACSAGSTSGTLRVIVSNPSAEFGGVNVTYRLKPDVIGCGGASRIVEADIGGPANVKFFNADGELMTSPLPVAYVDSYSIY